jgi:hypothetical protein
MLFALWNGQIHRPTVDLDLAGRGDGSLERLAGMFKGLCRLPVPDDGLVLDSESVVVETIRGLQRYQGTRVRLMAHLSTARIPLQIDIGYGDAVTPAPIMADFPTLLGHPAPRLRVYPQETVIAEKFQAMVFLGMANTRMKDFYDLWLLATSFGFQGAKLSRALRATFDRRLTPVPERPPIALTSEFFEDRSKVKAWSGFLRKSGLLQEPVSLAEVCPLLESFLLPPSQGAAAGVPFVSDWPPAGPWR